MKNDFETFYDSAIVHLEHIAFSLGDPRDLDTRHVSIVVHATKELPFKGVKRFDIINGFYKYRFGITAHDLNNIIKYGRDKRKNTAFFLGLKYSFIDFELVKTGQFDPTQRKVLNTEGIPQNIRSLEWPKLDAKKFPPKPPIKRRKTPYKKNL